MNGGNRSSAHKRSSSGKKNTGLSPVYEESTQSEESSEESCGHENKVKRFTETENSQKENTTSLPTVTTLKTSTENDGVVDLEEGEDETESDSDASAPDYPPKQVKESVKLFLDHAEKPQAGADIKPDHTLAIYNLIRFGRISSLADLKTVLSPIANDPELLSSVLIKFQPHITLIINSRDHLSSLFPAQTNPLLIDAAWKIYDSRPATPEGPPPARAAGFFSTFSASSYKKHSPPASKNFESDSDSGGESDSLVP